MNVESCTCSYLSPRYSELLLFDVSSDSVPKHLLTSRLTLDCKHLELDLRVNITDSEWCKNFVKKLIPVIKFVGKCYDCMPREKFLDNSDLLSWTGYQTQFVKCFDYVRRNETNVALGILVATALLERALGNLVLLKVTKVPSLLKDLLSLNELKDIIGFKLVTLLQTLVGTPLALNIRNILWHGFASPLEVDKSFGYFLLSLVLSIGDKLESKNIKISDIPQRPLITFDRASTCWENGVFPPLNCRNIDYILENVSLGGGLVAPAMQPYWINAMNYYKKGMHGECVVLLLPQLENVLRLLFAKANACPERVLTAESDALFTTFTEMLSQKMPDGSENELVKILGERFMEILYDLLINPEGPRMRDRLSHGEVDLSCVSQVISRHVICICAVLFFGHFRQCNSLPRPRGELLNANDAFVDQILSSVDNYESFFSPPSILKSNIVQLMTDFHKWKQFQIHLSVDLTSAFDYDRRNRIFERFKFGRNLLRHFDDRSFNENAVKFVDQIRLKSLYRPRYEMEVCTLLRQITYHATSSVTNICEALNVGMDLLSERKLRSRKRQNFHRLLSSLPVLDSGIQMVILLVACLVKNLNAVSEEDEDCRERLLKLLRTVLQHAENLNSQTSREKNRWCEASTLTCSFVEKMFASQRLNELKMFDSFIKILCDNDHCNICL